MKPKKPGKNRRRGNGGNSKFPKYFRFKGSSEGAKVIASLTKMKQYTFLGSELARLVSKKRISPELKEAALSGFLVYVTANISAQKPAIKEKIVETLEQGQPIDKIFQPVLTNLNFTDHRTNTTVRIDSSPRSLKVVVVEGK